MNQARKSYKSFTEEFKLEAIRLMDESDQSVSAIARDLGLRRNQLYKWKEQMDKKGEVSSSKRGRPKKENQNELVTLKQKLKRLEEENEILKKAAVFFAKQLD